MTTLYIKNWPTHVLIAFFLLARMVGDVYFLLVGTIIAGMASSNKSMMWVCGLQAVKKGMKRVWRLPTIKRHNLIVSKGQVLYIKKQLWVLSMFQCTNFIAAKITLSSVVGRNWGQGRCQNLTTRWQAIAHCRWHRVIINALSADFAMPATQCQLTSRCR